MSADHREGSNVLPFKRVTRSPPSTTVSDLHELLIVYDHLIALLRETDDEGLDALTDSIVISLVEWREAMNRGLDDAVGQKILQEMREGLRQFPRNLRSILPGLGARLGESMQHKLGIQFAEY